MLSLFLFLGGVVASIATRAIIGTILAPLTIAPTENRSTHYRPAIDGLRAIAVLAVFTFHLKHSWLPGGFVGVDIFFVISGYLIASILLRDAQRSHFSFTAFYQRRIARLMPTFSVVALATVGAAAVIYGQRDFASCGATLSSVMLSVANLKFLAQGNYFAISPDAQPLLHFWSLSVEEQFYLFFPAILILIHIRALRYRTGILVAIGVISLAIYVLLSRRNPSLAFFLLPSRAWELLAGAALSSGVDAGLFKRRACWNKLSIAGLTLIASALVFIRQDPGIESLIPVMGAVLFLGPFDRSDGCAERLLSWTPLVLIGRMSYSLYLWHWPVFSFIDYRFYMASLLVRTTVKVVLSSVLTTASFLLVEGPARRFLNRPVKRQLAYGFLLCSMIALVPLGMVIRKANFLDGDLSDVARGGCVYNAGGTKAAVVLFGDSNAGMYTGVLRTIAKQLDVKLTLLSAPSADPLPGRPVATPFWKESLRAISEIRPSVVVLGCHWTEKLQFDRGRLTDAIHELKRCSGSIILITQPPRLPVGADRESIRNGNRPPFMEDATARIERLAANNFVKSFAGGCVTVVDVETYFESSDGVITFADQEGHEYYFDNSHLSDIGAALMKDDLARAISRNVGVPAPARASDR